MPIIFPLAQIFLRTPFLKKCNCDNSGKNKRKWFQQFCHLWGRLHSYGVRIVRMYSINYFSRFIFLYGSAFSNTGEDTHVKSKKCQRQLNVFGIGGLIRV